MKIEYFGHSCFLITTETGTTVLTDPYTRVGYELPSGLRADLVTVSHEHFDHNYVQALDYAGVIVKGTGTFNEKDVRITGIATAHDPLNGALRGDNVVYKIEADGLTLCHMGDIGEPCKPVVVDSIGSVDVLFIPVGGNYTIDAMGAKAYIEAIKPKTVIVMHYRPLDGSIDIDTEQPFLALMGEYAEYQGEYDTKNGKGVVFMRRKVGI